MTNSNPTTAFLITSLGDFESDAEAIAVVGFARKLVAMYPAIVDSPRMLELLAADVRLLLSKVSNPRLRQALEECIRFKDFLWNGASFAAAVIDTRVLAYAVERVAECGGGGPRASSVPVRQPCSVPGKACWLVDRDLFVVDVEYTPINRIGKGAYGIVCSAKHPARAEKVAIKKISNAFEELTDAHRTLREIKLLRCLRHDNIIALLDVMRPLDPAQFKDVYLVYELMDTDLQEIIRSPQPLSNTHFQYFLCQILRGLKYIHSANVLHRDLKPSNMLVNSTCGLKICDFGLARTASSSANVFMTEYVVTRWYRAPELLLSCDSYGPPIDIWSVGCILAELLGRQPLFAGRDYLDSLKLIIRQLGSPTDQDLGFISSAKAREYIRTMPPTKRMDFRAQFPTAEPLAINLLERMLCFDPRQRISVEDALAHPWLSELHDTALEPCAPVRFEFDYEEEQLTSERVRDLVYEDILSYAG